MWWPEPLASRRQVIACLFALGACGFQPVHGPSGAGSRLFGRVGFATPATPAGYRLRSRLEDRLGRATRPDWTLAVDLEVTEEATAIAADGSQTRFTLLGAAPWRLTDATGAIVADGRERAFTAYSTTASTVATDAAATDARDRLARILADQLVTRLFALTSTG